MAAPVSAEIRAEYGKRCRGRGLAGPAAAAADLRATVPRPRTRRPGPRDKLTDSESARTPPESESEAFKCLKLPPAAAEPEWVRRTGQGPGPEQGRPEQHTEHPGPLAELPGRRRCRFAAVSLGARRGRGPAGAAATHSLSGVRRTGLRLIAGR
jgi:hypothetical protein